MVQQWMEEALTEFNATKREGLYYQIQKRLIEEVYPSIWLHSATSMDVFASNVGGYYPNWFKPQYYGFVYFK